MKNWGESHTDFLVGDRHEAEFQAAILATTLRLGKASGEGAGAACLDFSKIYDFLELDFLEEAVLSLGSRRVL